MEFIFSLSTSGKARRVYFPARSKSLSTSLPRAQSHSNQALELRFVGRHIKSKNISASSDQIGIATTPSLPKQDDATRVRLQQQQQQRQHSGSQGSSGGGGKKAMVALEMSGGGEDPSGTRERMSFDLAYRCFPVNIKVALI